VEAEVVVLTANVWQIERSRLALMMLVRERHR
jgi:hypothetical protein